MGYAAVMEPMMGPVVSAKLASQIASRFAFDNGNISLFRRHIPWFMPNTAENLRTILNARTPEGYVGLQMCIPQFFFGLCLAAYVGLSLIHK
jgi:hypothetical protein